MKFSKKNYDYFVEQINKQKFTRQEVVQCVKSFEAMEHYFQQPNKISTPTINTNGRERSTVKKKVTTTTTTTTIVTKKKVTREKKVKQVTETHLFVPLQKTFTIEDVETAMAKKMVIEITRNMSIKKWMCFLPKEMHCKFLDPKQKVSKEHFIKMVAGEDISRSSSRCSSASTVGYSSPPIVPTKKKKTKIKKKNTEIKKKKTEIKKKKEIKKKINQTTNKNNNLGNIATSSNTEESMDFCNLFSPFSSPLRKRSNSMNYLNGESSMFDDGMSPLRKRKKNSSVTPLHDLNLFDEEFIDDPFHSVFDSDAFNDISGDFDYTNDLPY
tara:strand:+ start:3157 stop:4134 length:978 start_codon:yes stop_codon:yes gene_type:complete